MSPSGRAAALVWVPPGFGAFDTGRAEEAAAPGSEAVPEEAHAWETAKETAVSEALPVPGNGHDPGALPAFLRRTA